ncbi:hypothetical protein [Methylocapsa palsarum]|uniref:Uncharacterized protein n=1 Tax=Methylocapsa palsarum TaxID=1612308 RepID=A0A1I3X1S5_9HYPH|nr:hypothetical protein [Methylocapsa palsarum]SFK13635.1 hypothetical protein SAMN05444581_102312 [Methylocapsa palsarum]
MLDTRVKDWTTEPHGAAVELTYSTLWRTFGVFLILAAAIWLSLYAISKSFPFVQNGATAIAEEKQILALNPHMFAPGDKIRVIAFGNSKTLAGFRPSVFSSQVGSESSAENLAIPGDSRFLDLLETALTHGAAPTHVFLQTLPLPEDEADRSQSPWNYFLDNKKMVKLLFPFRPFIRDAIIFAFESRSAGSLTAQYRSNASQIEKMREERGYYFIKSQSHYAGDRLPDGYSLPTDTPNKVATRNVDTNDPYFQRLMRLADQYDFQIVLIPTAYRPGEFAEAPPIDAESVKALKSFPRVHVVGPAYWIYDLAEFSDPVHLNMHGAERYSKQLAALFQGQIAARR